MNASNHMTLFRHCTCIAISCAALASLASTYYLDSFLGENTYAIGYGKWGVFSAAQAVCFNTHGVVRPGDGYYSAATLYPLDINGAHAQFAADGTGVTVTLALGPWQTTTNRMLMKLALLDRSVTSDPWAPLATGVIAFVNLYDGSNLVVQLTRKDTTNDNGVSIAATNGVMWRSEAPFTLHVNALHVEAWYDAALICAGAHGLPGGGPPAWFPSFTLGNAPWPTNTYTMGAVRVLAAGAAQQTDFADEFTGPDGAPPDSNKWAAVQTGGTVYLTNNGCRLAPTVEYGTVDLMMKQEYGTELRLQVAQQISFTVNVSDVTAEVPGGTWGMDVDVHFDLLPERWQRTGWWLNGTSLFVEVRFDISADFAQTNVKAYVYQHELPRATGTLISTIQGQYPFVPGAPLVVTVGEWEATVLYNGDLLCIASLPSAPLYEMFAEGMVVALGAKKIPGASGTSVTLDACEAVAIVPEPGACIVWALLGVALMNTMRRTP
jgi:hypothetical protein